MTSLLVSLQVASLYLHITIPGQEPQRRLVRAEACSPQSSSAIRNSPTRHGWSAGLCLSSPHVVNMISMRRWAWRGQQVTTHSTRRSGTFWSTLSTRCVDAEWIGCLPSCMFAGMLALTLRKILANRFSRALNDTGRCRAADGHACERRVDSQTDSVVSVWNGCCAKRSSTHLLTGVPLHSSHLTAGPWAGEGAR